MKIFLTLVINLVVLVQISQSHTIKPTANMAKYDLDKSDDVDPETDPYINSDDEEETTTSLGPPKEDELVFAHVIYRHGERDTPKHIELTNEGKMLLFFLGQYFRRRYGKLIGDGYQSDKIYVLSTDHDRTIMSAQATLAGMFEPNGTEKWHERILWQPVPVHTLPNVLDKILRPINAGQCPRYDRMYDWYIKESPEAKAMYRKYGKYFGYWSEKTGTKVEHIEHVFTICKKFVNQKHLNQTIPEWAEEAFAPGGPMLEIAEVIRVIRAKPDLVRLRSGFLLKEMLERFKAKQNHELDPDRALYMYSSHSSTTNTLLNGLELNLPFPELGSSFHFEMYKTPEDKYYLQLFLRQPDDENPKPVEIKKCGTKCSLKEFYEIYNELIPGEFEVECEKNRPKPNEETTSALNGHNAAGTNGNSRTFSIVLCSLWLIRKFIS